MYTVLRLYTPLIGAFGRYKRKGGVYLIVCAAIVCKHFLLKLHSCFLHALLTTQGLWKLLLFGTAIAHAVGYIREMSVRKSRQGAQLCTRSDDGS